MKYEGYMVGPALRKLRTDRGCDCSRNEICEF